MFLGIRGPGKTVIGISIDAQGLRARRELLPAAPAPPAPGLGSFGVADLPKSKPLLDVPLAACNYAALGTLCIDYDAHCDEGVQVAYKAAQMRVRPLFCSPHETELARGCMRQCGEREACRRSRACVQRLPAVTEQHDYGQRLPAARQDGRFLRQLVVVTKASAGRAIRTAELPAPRWPDRGAPCMQAGRRLRRAAGGAAARSPRTAPCPGPPCLHLRPAQGFTAATVQFSSGASCRCLLAPCCLAAGRTAVKSGPRASS